MPFKHDLASAVRFTIEIDEPNAVPKRVMIVETGLVVSPLMPGYDELLVPELTEAAVQYFEENATDLDRITIVSVRNA